MAIFKYTSPKNINLQNYIYAYCSGVGYIDSYKGYQFTKIYPSELSYLTFMVSKNSTSMKFEGLPIKKLHGVFLYKSSLDAIDLYSNNNYVDYFKILLTPTSVYELFGINPNQIEKNLLSVSDKSILYLYNKMKKIKEHNKRVDLVEKYLRLYLRYKSSSENNLYFINQTLQNILKIKMTELEKETGYSKVWINKNIKKSTGFNFQNLKNLKRINCALYQINDAIFLKKDISLSQIAQDCGYYDQNHFIKSFKKFTKQTPKEYIEKSSNFLIISQKGFSGNL